MFVKYKIKSTLGICGVLNDIFIIIFSNQFWVLFQAENTEKNTKDLLEKQNQAIMDRLVQIVSNKLQTVRFYFCFCTKPENVSHNYILEKNI